MGTRGLYVFKYCGIYYVFYNHRDSYPDGGLGDLIVSEIKNLDWVMVKTLLLKISEADVKKEELGENFSGLMNTLNDVKKHSLINITRDEPDLSCWEYDAEYIYILDIDRNIFKVIYFNETGSDNNKFNLDKIPENWKDLLV